MINNGELVDLPLVGKKFTWFGYDNKRSRLGRFLLSPGWLLKFRDICQRGFKHSVSDQCACSIVHWGCGLGPRPFKHFKCWLDDKECLESIKNQWIKNARHNDSGRDLFHKLPCTDLFKWRPSTVGLKKMSDIWRCIVGVANEDPVNKFLERDCFRWGVGNGTDVLLWDFFFRPLLDREASLLDDLCDLIKLIVVDPERLSWPGGLWGVLRNYLGVVLAMFSDPIGSAMPIVAELIAIKMALSLFIQSSRLRGKGLIIESDSAFAVSWWIVTQWLTLLPKMGSMGLCCLMRGGISIIISPGLGHWEGKAARVGLLTAAMAHGSTRIDSAVMFKAWI
ncbi:hypothetical protein Godav_017808 [Gossypium davidsonii]|uniref:RNase H type-1 domain-containing protein n=1 Tax=Gossypium davidsonii TaxID=34287 RepID=A0A7J8QUF3_GOSDV|nr:hypothetical protein [Gossypium davidsonii]